MNSRKGFQAVLGGFLILSLLVLSGCGLKAENEQLKKENVGLKQQVASLTAEAQDLKSKMTSLTTENESLKKENDALKSKLAPPKKGTSKKMKKI